LPFVPLWHGRPEEPTTAPKCTCNCNGHLVALQIERAGSEKGKLFKEKTDLQRQVRAEAQSPT